MFAMPEGHTGEGCVNWQDLIGRVWCGDALDWLLHVSPNLIVTSPPYNGGLDYGEGVDDQRPWPEYEEWARDWVARAGAALSHGGRLCINVAAVMGRSPAYPLAGLYLSALCEAGLLLRGEIVWDKGPSRNSSTAWGSWCSPANPSLRDSYEVVLVASKERYGAPNPRGEPTDISAEEFTRDTNSLWRIPCETTRHHPAPFPVELATRCIKLYSWPGDVVADPFCGSGSTLVAAIRCGRVALGCDLSPAYCAMAEKRIAREREKMRLDFGEAAVAATKGSAEHV